MIEIIECNPLFPLKLAISVNDFWAASLWWWDLEQVERVRRGVVGGGWRLLIVS